VLFFFFFYSSSVSYPHHYAPLLCDFADYLTTLEPHWSDGAFSMVPPRAPLVQLFCVLPPQSAALLPASYARAMLDPSSPVHLAQEPLMLDDEFSAASHEHKVLLPFLDMNRIEAALQPLPLTAEEQRRNCEGHVVLLWRAGSPAPEALLLGSMQEHHAGSDGIVRCVYNASIAPQPVAAAVAPLTDIAVPVLPRPMLSAMRPPAAAAAAPQPPATFPFAMPVHCVELAPRSVAHVNVATLPRGPLQGLCSDVDADLIVHATFAPAVRVLHIVVGGDADAEVRPTRIRCLKNRSAVDFDDFEGCVDILVTPTDDNCFVAALGVLEFAGCSSLSVCVSAHPEAPQVRVALLAFLGQPSSHG